MKLILERDGYEVVTAHYLASAVGQAINGNFDLVTLDLNMPGIDGREVADLLQKKEVDTKIMVVSAFIDEAVKDELCRLRH